MGDDADTTGHGIPKGKMIGIGVGAILIPLALVGLFLGLDCAAEPVITGSLTLVDEEDQTEIAPDQCESGNLGENAPQGRPRFFGVDLKRTAQSSFNLRVVDDPTSGKAVILTSPATPDGQRLSRETCERLDVRIEGTEMLIMDVWGMRGSVDLDCDAVRGSVTFDDCY